MSILVKVCVGAAVVSAVVTCIVAVNAAPGPGKPTTAGVDRISQSDRRFYSNTFAQAFGILEHDSQSVCGSVSLRLKNQRHCHARVLLASSGAPLNLSLPMWQKQIGLTHNKARNEALDLTHRTIGPPYTYSDIISAYGLPRNGFWRKPPIVAIVDAFDDPFMERDLATLDGAQQIAPLTNCVGDAALSGVPCLEKVNQGGTRSHYPAIQETWALEISLDVQTVHALCPKCTILLVEATDDSTTNLMAAIATAVRMKANVISGSWGGPEYADETSDDAKLDVPGVAMVFSSGDDGFAGDNSPEFPAASRYVTAVGGTSLYLNPDGSYAMEVAWSGTGSGCSHYVPAPPWQVGPTYAIGCANRVGNDVSALADPNTGVWIYDSIGFSGQPGGWFAMGGTSLAAPIVAAIYALAHDIPSNTPGNVLPMQRHAQGVLRDVTFGTSGGCGNYVCNARPGFDGPTGWGTPVGVGGF